jgi:hypothetical protein
MKTKFLFMMIAAATMVFSGCSKDDDESAKTPPYAATTQTWTFGDQTWSDAIQMPDCNKEAFEDSETVSQGRSYTSGGKAYYYYNWAYVNANKNKLCPSPWRVPTALDFGVLVSYNILSTVADAWGTGGYAIGSSIKDVSSSAYFWSSEVGGHYYYYYLGEYADDLTKAAGMQVRCVKDN